MPPSAVKITRPAPGAARPRPMTFGEKLIDLFVPPETEDIVGRPNAAPLDMHQASVDAAVAAAEDAGEAGTAERVLHEAPRVNPDADPGGVAARVAHSQEPAPSPSLAPTQNRVTPPPSVAAARAAPPPPASGAGVGSNPGLPSLARARAQVEAERRAAGVVVPPAPPAIIPPSTHSPRTSGVSDARPAVAVPPPAPVQPAPQPAPQPDAHQVAPPAPPPAPVPVADRDTLLARIRAGGDPNSRATPRPLLTPAEFLSLHGTLGNVPFAMPYRLALHALGQRPDVSGVYLAVAGLDKVSSVPHADTVWVLTGADPETTAARLPAAYRPTIQWHGLMADLPLAPWPEPPAPGHAPVGLWWG